jgi:hypothetical protein
MSKKLSHVFVNLKGENTQNIVSRLSHGIFWMFLIIILVKGKVFSYKATC